MGEIAKEIKENKLVMDIEQVGIPEITPKGDLTLEQADAIYDQITNKVYSENHESVNIKETDLPKKQGGSYGEVFEEGEGDKYEVHHMPADSISGLERNDGPAIKMEKSDHRQTASWGSSKDAQEYRSAQKELIEQGKFKEALQMDIDDIREKFGDKYDDAILEMLDYVEKLETEGKIDA